MAADSREIVLSRHSRTGACVNSQRLWHHAWGLHSFKPDKIPVWGRGSGHKAALLTKGLFCRKNIELTRLSAPVGNFPLEPRYPMCPHAKKVVPSREQSTGMGRGL